MDTKNHTTSIMKYKNLRFLIFLVGISFFIVGFTKSWIKLTSDIQVVRHFEKEKYLGNWHEIARLDHHFEKDLEHVKAHYTVNDDGTITVVNTGYNREKDEWKKAEGIAKFVSGDSLGRLKVSFFKPFYSGYNVVYIDSVYKNAMVYGNNKKSMWILSRHKTIDSITKQHLLKKAEEDGYEVASLIWVKQ